MEPNQVEAVHITDESEVDHHKLKTKWKEHLPLGRKTGDPLNDLKQIFPETFDGQVGLFEGEASLKVSSNTKPVQLPPRSVPQSIMPELKKMEQEGIIRPCLETTEWVHNIVTVVKKDGSLRLCLDPRNLNKYLIRNVHYTASWEDALHSFKNGQYFSTLEAKSGYWTKKTCMNRVNFSLHLTHPLRNTALCAYPLGSQRHLKSSVKKWIRMDQVLSGVPGTFPCADDVKVQWSTEERHDIHLLETVERACKAGLKFNPNKCCIKKQEIEYFGRIITPQGVKPCPKKVKSIAMLAAPKDKQDLQSLLGTVNFMSAFIPNLTKKTHLMRSLLKCVVLLLWTSDIQKKLDTIKNEIANAVQLTHYDPNKSAVIG